MHQARLYVALAGFGFLLLEALNYDATLLAVRLGLTVQGGEGAIALAGLIVALACVAFGLRALSRSRLDGAST